MITVQSQVILLLLIVIFVRESPYCNFVRHEINRNSDECQIPSTNPHQLNYRLLFKDILQKLNSETIWQFP